MKIVRLASSTPLLNLISAVAMQQRLRFSHWVFFGTWSLGLGHFRTHPFRSNFEVRHPKFVSCQRTTTNVWPETSRPPVFSPSPRLPTVIDLLNCSFPCPRIWHKTHPFVPQGLQALQGLRGNKNEPKPAKSSEKWPAKPKNHPPAHPPKIGRVVAVCKHLRRALTFPSFFRHSHFVIRHLGAPAPSKG